MIREACELSVKMGVGVFEYTEYDNRDQFFISRKWYQIEKFSEKDMEFYENMEKKKKILQEERSKIDQKRSEVYSLEVWDKLPELFEAEATHRNSEFEYFHLLSQYEVSRYNCGLETIERHFIKNHSLLANPGALGTLLIWANTYGANH